MWDVLEWRCDGPVSKASYNSIELASRYNAIRDLKNAPEGFADAVRNLAGNEATG